MQENLFITNLNKQQNCGQFIFGNEEPEYAIGDSYKTPIDLNESCKRASN